MSSRDVDRGAERGESRGGGDNGSPPPFEDVVLRQPPNRLVVVVLGVLGGFHLLAGLPVIATGAWVGYLPIIAGGVFVLGALVTAGTQSELAVLSSQRRLRFRRGVAGVYAVRSIPFAAVRGVRLTLWGDPRRPHSRIELLGPDGDLPCPPTRIPRQQALFFAMVLGVPLTKITREPAARQVGEAERMTETAKRRIA